MLLWEHLLKISRLINLCNYITALLLVHDKVDGQVGGGTKRNLYSIVLLMRMVIIYKQF